MIRTALLLTVVLVFSGCTLKQARIAAWTGVAADCVTTQVALNQGLAEGNPLMGDYPVRRSAVISSAILGGAYLLEPYDPKGATWFYRFVTVVRGGAAAYNLNRVIREHRHGSDNTKKPAAAQAPVVGLMVAW